MDYKVLVGRHHVYVIRLYLYFLRHLAYRNRGCHLEYICQLTVMVRGKMKNDDVSQARVGRYMLKEFFQCPYSASGSADGYNKKSIRFFLQQRGLSLFHFMILFLTGKPVAGRGYGLQVTGYRLQVTGY